MPGFIRVRAAKGPKHEFHAAVDEVRVNPDLYEIVSDVVVGHPTVPKYVVPAQKAKDSKPVGETNKENK